VKQRQAEGMAQAFVHALSPGFWLGLLILTPWFGLAIFAMRLLAKVCDNISSGAP